MTGSRAIGAGATVAGSEDPAEEFPFPDESVGDVPGLQSPRFTTCGEGCCRETMTARRAGAAGFSKRTQEDVVPSRPP